MIRPDPPFEVHPGHEWRVEVDIDFTMDPEIVGSHRCRASAGGGGPGCGRPVIAALMRPTNRYRARMDLSGRIRRPWHYCAEHLYGRWIEDGRVVGWVVRPIGQIEP